MKGRDDLDDMDDTLHFLTFAEVEMYKQLALLLMSAFWLHAVILFCCTKSLCLMLICMMFDPGSRIASNAILLAFPVREDSKIPRSVTQLVRKLRFHSLSKLK